MEGRIVELLRRLYGRQEEEELLLMLSTAACGRLNVMLRDGVAAEDCGNSYLIAAAWMVLDWLNGADGSGRVTALSAGDMSVRLEGGPGQTRERVQALMAPWVKGDDFAFLGVRGC